MLHQKPPDMTRSCPQYLIPPTIPASFLLCREDPTSIRHGRGCLLFSKMLSLGTISPLGPSLTDFSKELLPLLPPSGSLPHLVASEPAMPPKLLLSMSPPCRHLQRASSVLVFRNTRQHQSSGCPRPQQSPPGFHDSKGFWLSFPLTACHFSSLPVKAPAVPQGSVPSRLFFSAHTFS